MANNAQNSQNKSDNLGRGRVAYAFKISRVNPDFVSLKIWILGYYSKVCSIAVSSLPRIVAQIDTALAEGECEFELGGIRFSADEKLLKSIRKEFSSYCCSGVSDANNAPVNPPRVVEAESVKRCGAKQKASAPQGSASAARQLSNEKLRMKNEENKRSAFECCASNNPEGARRFANANASQLGGQSADTAKKKNNSSFLILHSSFPKTRRGRTSVVVGVRKISTLKKQK